MTEQTTVLVTGGGQGIGRAVVERFLRDGARVAVVQRGALDPELADDDRVLEVRADLAAPEEPERIAEEVVRRVVDRWGGLDVLVNNAGLMLERGVGELTGEDWRRSVAVNLTAPLFLARAAAPHMARRGGGAVITTGSVEATATHPDHVAYATTKAGVEGMTRALAIDLGPQGIRVCGVAPGWVDTRLNAAMVAEHDDAAAFGRRLTALHPLGRVGTPEDIASAVTFLAGDDARFITGETITVDGGRTSRLPASDVGS